MNALVPIGMLASALTASSLLYFRFKHKSTCPQCNELLVIEAKRRLGPGTVYYCEHCNKRFTNGVEE